MFAQMMSAKPSRYGQVVELVPVGDPATVAGAIARRVDEMVADRTIAAAALLLPEGISLEELTSFALALSGYPHWHVRTSALPTTPAGPMVALHIVREIPFAGGVCPSEALVLGPFNEFPPTRRAPVVAFEIFVGDPPPYDYYGTPTSKGNLASVALPMVKPHTYSMVWKKSIAGRLASNNGEDSRAKAKISFVISPALAAKMGCTP
jgi:hypothetical protein